MSGPTIFRRSACRCSDHRLVLHEEERFRGLTVDRVLARLVEQIPVPVA